MPLHPRLNPAPTGEQARRTIDLLRAVADVIKAAGPLGIPSGHLYANLMSGVSLESYNRMIDMLIELGIIRKTNHVLTYIEQTKPTD